MRSAATVRNSKINLKLRIVFPLWSGVDPPRLRRKFDTFHWSKLEGITGSLLETENRETDQKPSTCAEQTVGSGGKGESASPLLVLV
jgi:hypothetical protein